MNNFPLVSVVTIFFNEERFLQEAIESILVQHYTNWELLLVDDGSGDKSTKIAQAYAVKFPDKIRYLEHEGHQNKGMSATRNLGIKEAKGDYIGFLDADDIWLPNKLSEQVAIMQKNPEAALVCGRTQWWFSWAEKPEAQDFLQNFPLSLNQLVKPPQILLMFLEDEGTSLCDILVRKEVVHQVGGYEDLFKGMYEDQAFHAKICLNFPVYVSSQCWYLYRQHSGSCCNVAEVTGKERIARTYFLKWLAEYLAKQSHVHLEVRKAFKRAVWKHKYPNLNALRGKMIGLGVSVGRNFLPVPVRQLLWKRFME